MTVSSIRREDRFVRRKIASLAVGVIAAAACFVPSVAHASGPGWVPLGCGSWIQVVQTLQYLKENGSGHSSTVTTSSLPEEFCAYGLNGTGTDFVVEIRDVNNNCLSVDTSRTYDGHYVVGIEGASACENNDNPWDMWQPAVASDGGFYFTSKYNNVGCMYVNTEAIVTSCSTVQSDQYQQFNWPY